MYLMIYVLLALAWLATDIGIGHVKWYSSRFLTVISFYKFSQEHMCWQAGRLIDGMVSTIRSSLRMYSLTVVPAEKLTGTRDSQ